MKPESHQSPVSGRVKFALLWSGKLKNSVLLFGTDLVYFCCFQNIDSRYNMYQVHVLLLRKIELELESVRPFEIFNLHTSIA